MAKPVDTSYAKQAMLKAQRPQAPQATQKAGGRMGIGNRPTARAGFSDVLQENLNLYRGAAQAKEGLQEREGEAPPRERPREAPKQKETGGRQESLVARRGAEESVKEMYRQEDSRERDSKEQSRGREGKDSTQHAKEAEQRVVAREGKGDAQGRGTGGEDKGRGENQAKQGQQQSGQHGRGQEGKSPAASPKVLQTKYVAQGLITGQASKAQGTLTEAPLPTRLPQRLLDQVVKYARLLVNAHGEKEMHFALHEEIFKGLRLRIAKQGTKIEVTFITSHRDVRDLFQAERGAIRKALTEKDIDVGDIDVIMT